MFMVEDAMTNPTSAMDKEPIIWNDLSPTVSECLQRHINLQPSPPKKQGTYLATANATRLANTPGGAQSRRVTVRPYPSVAARVGKNALKERETMMQLMLGYV